MSQELAIIETFESSLEETGKYPLPENLPHHLQAFIKNNPNKVNALLAQANLPQYYEPLSFTLNTEPFDPQPPVEKLRGRFLERGTSELDLNQKMALKLVLDYHDKRSLKAKLNSLQLTTLTWNQWLKDPKFKDKLRKEIDKRFGDLESDAKLSLAQLVVSGDLNAIRYFHEFAGLYRPESETVINLTRVVSRLMEVLVKYLTPEQLEEVANVIEVGVTEGKELTK